MSPNTAGDATEFAEISAEKSPLCENTQVHSCGTVCMRGAAALCFSRLPLTSRRPTHIQLSKCNAHAHARTPIHLHAFMFTRSGRWILRAPHFFFLGEALHSANPDTVCIIIQHQPGRAAGYYSKRVCEFGFFVMHPFQDSCFSFTLPAYQPGTHAGIVMSLTSARPNELTWRGTAALGTISHRVPSCVCESVLLRGVLGWLGITCSTPACRLRSCYSSFDSRGAQA